MRLDPGSGSGKQADQQRRHGALQVGGNGDEHPQDGSEDGAEHTEDGGANGESGGHGYRDVPSGGRLEGFPV